MHRDLHGEKNDHALVECKWTWRIRTKKTQACKDFDCLFTQKRDKAGSPTECMIQFEEVVSKKLKELAYDATTNSATEMYDKICESINFAMDTVLPTRRRGTGVHRKVSEKTRALYEKRTRLCKHGTVEEFNQVQNAIKNEQSRRL